MPIRPVSTDIQEAFKTFQSVYHNRRLTPRRTASGYFNGKWRRGISETICLTILYHGCNREEPGPLFGSHQWDATENEVHGANFWGLTMRDDEERGVDPPLEFKRIEKERKRND
ncbi:hypothetical protein TNCV_1403221 [Trichonephila clavipes]|nr:hypothetical protein TNCV_1403221 [Trichonephila clavipes]